MKEFSFSSLFSLPSCMSLLSPMPAMFSLHCILKGRPQDSWSFFYDWLTPPEDRDVTSLAKRVLAKVKKKNYSLYSSPSSTPLPRAKTPSTRSDCPKRYPTWP